jgi:TP901 family phage tail tape measure protein
VANNQLNFQVNALGNFSQINAEITKLKAAMLELQKIPLIGSGGAETIARLKDAQNQFDKMVLSTRAFSIESVKMADSLERSASLLESGKLKLHDYFKIWRDEAKGTSQLLDNVASQQARIAKSFVIPDLLKPGYAKVITNLNASIKDLGAAEEQAAIKARLLNSALRDGANQVINLGKNTQWAGRQLTVGLTVPLAALGAMAGKAFNDVDKELTRMAKVYGDGLTVTSQQTINAIRQQTVALAQELAKTYGMAASQTAATAADLAATGLQGQQLLEATRQTMRLATLGELDQQSAIKATVALQRTYRLSSKELADSVNYLNAVENQTSTSLGDLVEALPRASVIVKELGGSYKDLSAMMVAMREAGVPAAEAANSIKSALASIINPSKQAREDLNKLGIDIKNIVDSNTGDLIGTVSELQKALDNLDPTTKTRMIEELFGKFQFAKVAALLDNLGKAGSQTQKAFELAYASSSQLARLAEQELKQQTESISGRWNRAIQQLKADFLPIGQQVVKVGTKVLEVFSKVLEVVNKLGPLKNVLGAVIGGVAIAGPLLMISGLFINLIGQIAKMTNYWRMFREGFKDGGIKGGMQNLSNFFEVVDKSTMAATKGMQDLNTSTENSLKSFQKLTEQIQRLALVITDISNKPLNLGNPAALRVNQPYAGMTPEQMLQIDPYYGPGQKIAGVERPHMLAGSDLLKSYRQESSGYSNLQELEQQMGTARFEQYMNRGISSQFKFSSKGAAADLQQAYGTEPVIYDGETGLSKSEVYARETQRLIKLHDDIIQGTFKGDEKTVTQLTAILGDQSKIGQAVTPEQLAQLHSIIDQVTFSQKEFTSSQIEHLVQMNAMLNASEGTLNTLNKDLQQAYSASTIEERSALVKQAWMSFQDNLMLELANDATVLNDLANFRASTTSAIASAGTVAGAAKAAANIQAGIQMQATRAGGIYKDLLQPTTSRDSLLAAQSLSDVANKTPKPYAAGGHVSGPGGPTDDKIPALLSDGEYVIKASSVNRYGIDTLHAINNQKFANGGIARLNGGGEPSKIDQIRMAVSEWIASQDVSGIRNDPAKFNILRDVLGIRTSKDLTFRRKTPIGLAGSIDMPMDLQGQLVALQKGNLSSQGFESLFAPGAMQLSNPLASYTGKDLDFLKGKIFSSRGSWAEKSGTLIDQISSATKNLAWRKFQFQDSLSRGKNDPSKIVADMLGGAMFAKNPQQIMQEAEKRIRLAQLKYREHAPFGRIFDAYLERNIPAGTQVSPLSTWAKEVDAKYMGKSISDLSLIHI